METSMSSPRLVTNLARDSADLSDNDLLAQARQGEEAAIRTLLQRHNRRLFRAARSVVGDDAEAEDVVQASYVSAFTHLHAFRSDSQFSTWLTRIALNEALGRLRRRRPRAELDEVDAERNSAQIIQFRTGMPADPEAEVQRLEIRRTLEHAIDRLPIAFRTVFVLRDVEGLSGEDTALQLGIRPETVRTRLHRARKLLRAEIEQQLRGAFSSLYPFDGERCVSMGDRVMEELGRRRPITR
jgi:RNA polymerase sigma-70 factor (ECF subfamily)